jgi:hypothetical protein
MAAVTTSPGVAALLRATSPGTGARRRKRQAGTVIRTRRRKVHGVSVTLAETRDYWLVTVLPGPELREQGIREHASQVRRCRCALLGRTLYRGRCRACRGMNTMEIAGYQLRLLKRYPKVTVTERAAAEVAR